MTAKILRRRHIKLPLKDVEPVWEISNIKYNYHFERFMLRGKEKVSIEFGLLALAQNIRKKYA
ncbi:MAG: transposase [Ginsengibacter sp.]